MNIQELYLRYADKIGRLSRGDSLMRIGHLWYGSDEDTTVVSIRSISDKKISTVFPLRAESAMSFTSSEAPTDAVVVQIIVHYNAFDQYVKELLAFSLCSPVVQVINPVIAAIVAPIAHNTDFYMGLGGLPAKDIEDLVSGNADEIRGIYSKAIIPMVINNIAIQTMDESAENITLTFQLTRVKSSGGAVLENEKPVCYLKNIEDVYTQAGILNKLKNYGGDTKAVDMLAGVLGIEVEKFRNIIEELKLEDIARKPGSEVINISSPEYNPIRDAGRWISSFGLTASYLSDNEDGSAFNEVLPEGGFSPEITYDVADCKYLMYLIKYIANTLTKTQLETIESDIGGKILLPYDRFKKVSTAELTGDQTFTIASKYASQKTVSDTISRNIEIFDLSSMFHGADAPGTHSDRLVALVDGASAICQDYYETADPLSPNDPLLSYSLVSIVPGADVPLTSVIDVVIWKINQAIVSTKNSPANTTTLKNVLRQAHLFRDYCKTNNITVALSDGEDTSPDSVSIWTGLTRSDLTTDLVCKPDPAKNIDPNKPDAAVGLTNAEFAALMTKAIAIANQRAAAAGTKIKYYVGSARRTLLQQCVMYSAGRESSEICRKLCTLAGMPAGFVGNVKPGAVWSGAFDTKSPHVQGRAVDIEVSRKVYLRDKAGKEDARATYAYLVDAVRELGEAEKMPIIWGGDFILTPGDDTSRDWPHFEFFVESKTSAVATRNTTLGLAKYSSEEGLEAYAKRTGTAYPEGTPTYNQIVKSVKRLVGGYGSIVFKGSNADTVRAEYAKLFSEASAASDKLLSDIYTSVSKYLKIDLSGLVEHIDISYTPGASVPIPLEGARTPVVQCMGGRQVDINVTFKVTDLVDIAQISTLFGIATPVNKVISMLRAARSVYAGSGEAMSNQRLQHIYNIATRQQIYENLKSMAGKSEVVDLDDPIYITNPVLNGLGLNTFVATGYNVSTVDAITNGFNITVNFSYSNMRYRSNETLMLSKAALAENILPYALRIPFAKKPGSDETITMFDGKNKALGWQGSIDSAADLRFYKELASAVQGLAFPELLGVYMISRVYDLYVGLCHIKKYSEIMSVDKTKMTMVDLPEIIKGSGLENKSVLMALMEYGRLVNESGGDSKLDAEATLEKIVQIVDKNFISSGLSSDRVINYDMLGTYVSNSSLQLTSEISGKTGSVIASVLLDTAIQNRMKKASIVRSQALQVAEEGWKKAGSKVVKGAKVAGAAASVVAGAVSVMSAYNCATKIKEGDQKTLPFTFGLLCPIMAHMLCSEFLDAMEKGPGEAKLFISSFAKKAYRVLSSPDGSIVYDPPTAMFKFNVTDMSPNSVITGDLPIKLVTLAMSTGFAASTTTPQNYKDGFSKASEALTKASSKVSDPSTGLLQFYACLLGFNINVLSLKAIQYFSALTGVSIVQVLTETSETISGKSAGYSDAAIPGVDHAYQVLMGIFSQNYIPDVAAGAIINLANGGGKKNDQLVGFPFYESLVKAATYYAQQYTETSGTKKGSKLSQGRLTAMFIEDSFYDTNAVIDGKSCPNVLRSAFIGFMTVVMARATDFAIDGTIFNMDGTKRSKPGDTPSTSDGFGAAEIELSDALQNSGGADFTLNGMFSVCTSANQAAMTAAKTFLKDIRDMMLDPVNLASFIVVAATWICKTIIGVFASGALATIATAMLPILVFLGAVAAVVTAIYLALLAVTAIFLKHMSVALLKSSFTLSMWLACRLAEGLDRSRILCIFNSANAWSLKPLLLDHDIYDAFNSTYPDYPNIAVGTRSIYGSSFASSQAYIPIAPDGYIYHLGNIENNMKSLEQSMNNLIDVAASASPKNLLEAYEQIKSSANNGILNDLHSLEMELEAVVKACYAKKSDSVKPAHELARMLNEVASITADGKYSPYAFGATVGAPPSEEDAEFNAGAGIGIFIIVDNDKNISNIVVKITKSATFFSPIDNLDFNKWKCLRDRIKSNKLYSDKNHAQSAIEFKTKVSDTYAEKMTEYNTITVSENGILALFDTVARVAEVLSDVSLANLQSIVKNTTTTMSDLETIRGLVSSTFNMIGSPGLQKFKMGLGEMTLKNMYQSTRYTSGYSFPTVKLYFVEQDQDAWYLFDDMYSYTSVIDIAINSHINRPTAFATLRVTNLHGNLSNIVADKFNREGVFSKSQASNAELNAIFVKPGCRIKIQMGMDSILTDDDTVFCGEVSNIDFGPVTTIEAVGFGNVFNTVLAGERATVYGDLGFLGGFFGKAFATVKGWIDHVWAKFIDGVPGDYTINRAKSIVDVISNIFADSTTILSSISDFTIDPSLAATGNVESEESLFLNTQNALMSNRFMPELSSQFSDISGVSLAIHVNKQLYENVSILGSSDVEFRASSIASLMNKVNVDGKGAWTIYNQTIWDALQEVNLLLPNRLLLVRPYETRGTLVWGSQEDYYKYKRTVDLGSVIATLGYERSKAFSESGATGLYKILDIISSSSNSANNELITACYNITLALSYYTQKEIELLSVKSSTIFETVRKAFDVTALIESAPFTNDIDSFRRYAKAILNSFLYVLSFTAENLAALSTLASMFTEGSKEIDQAKSIEELNQKLKAILGKTFDKYGTVSEDIYKIVTKWREKKQDVLKEVGSISQVGISESDLVGARIYLFESAFGSLIEHVRHICGTRSTSYKKISDIHIKVSGRDIVKNDLVLQMPFNTVSLDFPPSFSSTPKIDDIIRQGEGKLNNKVVPVHYKLRDSAQRRYNTYFKNVNAFPGTRSSLINAVAVNILTNLMKDTYTGSIVLLGDASIREGDRILIWDENHDMFGFIRVRSHTLTMNANDGFISTIEPEMVTSSASYIEKEARSAFFAIFNGAMWIGAAALVGKNIGVYAKKACSAYRLRLAAEGLADTRRAKVAEVIEKNAPTSMVGATLFPANMGLFVTKKVYSRAKSLVSKNKKDIDISGEARLAEVSKLYDVALEKLRNSKGAFETIGSAAHLTRLMMEKSMMKLRVAIPKATASGGKAASKYAISKLGFIAGKIAYTTLGRKVAEYFRTAHNKVGKSVDRVAKLMEDGSLSVYDLPVVDMKTGVSGSVGTCVHGTNSPITIKNVFQSDPLGFSRGISDAEAESVIGELEKAMELSLAHNTSAGKTLTMEVKITLGAVERNDNGAITKIAYDTVTNLKDGNTIVHTLSGANFSAAEKKFADNLEKIVMSSEKSADNVAIEYDDSEMFILKEVFSVDDAFFTVTKNNKTILNVKPIAEFFQDLKGQVLLNEFIENSSDIYSKALVGHFGMCELFKMVGSASKAHFKSGSNLSALRKIRKFFIDDDIFERAVATHEAQMSSISKVRESSDEMETVADHLFLGMTTADPGIGEEITLAAAKEVGSIKERRILSILIDSDQGITDAAKIDVSTRVNWRAEAIDEIAKEGKVVFNTDGTKFIPRRAYVECEGQAGHLRLATPAEIETMISEAPESAAEFDYLKQVYETIISLRRKRKAVSTIVEPALNPASGTVISKGKIYSKAEYENICSSLDEVFATKADDALSFTGSKTYFKEVAKEGGAVEYELTDVGASALKEYYNVAAKLLDMTPTTIALDNVGLVVEKMTASIKATQLKDALTKLLSSTAVSKEVGKHYAKLFKDGVLDDDALVNFIKKNISDASTASMKRLINNGGYIDLAIEIVAKQSASAKRLTNAETVAALQAAIVDEMTKDIAAEMVKNFGDGTSIGKMFADTGSEPYVKLREYVEYMASDVDGKFAENCQMTVEKIQNMSTFERKVLQEGIKQAVNPVNAASLTKLGADIFSITSAYWAASSFANAVQNLTDLYFSIPQSADMVTISPIFFRGNPMVTGLDGVVKKDQDNPGVLDVLVGSRFEIMRTDVWAAISDPLVKSQKELWDMRYANGSVKASTTTGSSNITKAAADKDLYGLSIKKE